MILEKSSDILIHIVDIRFAFLSTKINSVSLVSIKRIRFLLSLNYIFMYQAFNSDYWSYVKDSYDNGGNDEDDDDDDDDDGMFIFWKI